MNKIELGMVWYKDGHKLEVTKMFKNGKVQVTETWVSEDTWKDCKHVSNCVVVVDENGNEYMYDPKYEEYANPGNDNEYEWWARTYANSADYSPSMEAEKVEKTEDNSMRRCDQCKYAYRMECIGKVMCPAWEEADGENIAETCPNFERREDEDDYDPDDYKDYSPSNPWDAPGMCISDFI